jgi:hypothetical protein
MWPPTWSESRTSMTAMDDGKVEVLLLVLGVLVSALVLEARSCEARDSRDMYSRSAKEIVDIALISDL